MFIHLGISTNCEADAMTTTFPRRLQVFLEEHELQKATSI